MCQGLGYGLGSVSHISGALTNHKSHVLHLSVSSVSAASQPVLTMRLVASGRLVCSKLSLSEPSAVSMPNPDVTGNWAPQIRKAGTQLRCCKQLGQSEPLPLAACCRVQEEREEKNKRKK